MDNPTNIKRMVVLKLWNINDSKTVRKNVLPCNCYYNVHYIDYPLPPTDTNQTCFLMNISTYNTIEDKRLPDVLCGNISRVTISRRAEDEVYSRACFRTAAV